ncbi:MAG: hypothetical protein ACR2HA_13710, partial [Nocardioides sp.]
MLAVLGTLIIASGFVVLSAPTATAAGTDKVFVCKFITTPGEGEILQTGDNPLSVSVSAIVGADPNTAGASLVGRSFTDGQERSLVIAVDDTPPGPEGDPGVSACLPKVAIPAQPQTTDPCGPGNIAFIVPADTDQLDFTLLANGNVTVAPQPGFRFDQESQLVTFILPADSGVLCTTTVAIPAQPATTDPCGPGNIAFVVPADTDQLDFTLLANGNVTVAPKAGFVFEGASQLVTFTLPADSGVLCTSTVAIPGQPTTTDPCGPGNIAFVVPADTVELDFTLLANGNVTVAPKAGLAFEGTSQLVTFTLPADSGVLCPVDGEDGDDGDDGDDGVDGEDGAPGVDGTDGTD